MDGTAVHPGSGEADGIDGRVAAAMAVLGGAPVDQVARALELEGELIERWTQQFVEGGRARVLNRPTGDEAQARDRFMTVVAHELRTPLTVIKAALELLARTGEADTSQTKLTKRAIANVLRLEEFANALDDTGAAALGRLRLDRRPTDLGELLRAITEVTEVRSEETGVRVDADPERLRAVIDDLLRACSGGEISVQITAGEVWATLQVRRTPPLQVDEVHRLLDPFDAGQDASAVTLGLYRARAIVVAHGGQLGASADEDSTTLWVRLPLPPNR